MATGRTYLDDVGEKWTGTGAASPIVLEGAFDASYNALTASEDGLTFGYRITHQGAGVLENEVGEGVYTHASKQLTRATIFKSTNGGAAVNFSSGDKLVEVVATAADFAAFDGKPETVFGRTGAVVAASGDYAASLVTNDSAAAGADVAAALDNLHPTAQEAPADANWTYTAALGRFVGVRFATSPPLTAIRDAILPAEAGLQGALVLIRNPGASAFDIRIRTEDPGNLGTYIDRTLGKGRTMIFRKDVDSGPANPQWWSFYGPDLPFVNQHEILGGITAGFAAATGFASTDLTEKTTHATGDFFLGWESGGALRKFGSEFANLGTIALNTIPLTQDGFADPVTLTGNLTLALSGASHKSGAQFRCEVTGDGASTIGVDNTSVVWTDRVDDTVPAFTGTKTLALEYDGAAGYARAAISDTVEDRRGLQPLTRSDAATAVSLGDSDELITTAGAVTIPNGNSAGRYFQCLLEIGADTHDITFNSLTLDISAQGIAAGELYSVVVGSSSKIWVTGPTGQFTEASFA